MTPIHELLNRIRWDRAFGSGQFEIGYLDRHEGTIQRVALDKVTFPDCANVVNGIISGTVWPFVGAAVILACTGMGLYASRRGKFVVWARLLEQLSLRGNERILDMGCGRGAILLLAAERLVSGRAVGVDLWKKGDQSGNAEEATLRNAKAEGVAERVELHTADMTALPFDDNTFDEVLSNLAIHNVKGRAGRAQAVAQAVRVLRPGGRLMIADILGTRHYRSCLIELGMLDITSRSLGWRMWWSGPWLATRLLTATKPLKAEVVCSPVA